MRNWCLSYLVCISHHLLILHRGWSILMGKRCNLQYPILFCSFLWDISHIEMILVVRQEDNLDIRVCLNYTHLSKYLVILGLSPTMDLILWIFYGNIKVRIYWSLQKGPYLVYLQGVSCLIHCWGIDKYILNVEFLTFSTFFIWGSSFS